MMCDILMFTCMEFAKRFVYSKMCVHIAVFSFRLFQLNIVYSVFSNIKIDPFYISIVYGEIFRALHSIKRTRTNTHPYERNERKKCEQRNPRFCNVRKIMFYNPFMCVDRVCANGVCFREKKFFVHK